MIAAEATHPSASSHLPRGEARLLALDGELCTRELAELSEVLQTLGGASNYQLVLDLSEVTHFDYRGVKPLIAFAERCRDRGGDIKLAGLSRYLHAIFRSVGAHDAFEYFTTAEDARAAFAVS